MKRLTTDNPQDNIETSLNLFYAKDGWTWIRGGGPAPDYADVSLNDFVRMLVKANIPDAELPEDNDDLSDLMCDWLIDDPDSAEGIISLLYTAGWAFAELRHRLAAYEDTGMEPEEIVGLQKQNDLLAQYGAQKFSSSMEDFKEINSLKLKIQSLEMSLSVACDGLNKYTQAEQEGRLVVLDEETALAMCAGARAIEQSKRFQGTTYCWDVFGKHGGPKELSYYEAANKLRCLAEGALEGGNGDG